MSYEDFAKDDPSQIVLGLFNGELQAVYLFSQTSPTEFEAHFTSTRKAPRNDVLAGACTLVQWFNDNGFVMVAHIAPRNIPLRRFVKQAGLFFFCEKSYGQNDTDRGSISATSQLWLEYRSQVNPDRVIRQKTDDSGNDI